MQEHGASCQQRVMQLVEADEMAKETRRWLKSLRKNEEAARKAAVGVVLPQLLRDTVARLTRVIFCWLSRFLQEKALVKAGKQALKVTKTKSKTVDGGHVWQRNEQLTLRVGPLPKQWEKKLDAVYITCFLFCVCIFIF